MTSPFEIVNKFREKRDKLEDFFNKKCIFFEFIKITLYEFIIYLTFIAIYIAMTIKMVVIQHYLFQLFLFILIRNYQITF